MRKPRLLTFYYPGFTNCPSRNAAAGTTINEWDLVQNHTPSPFVQRESIIPLLGYQDSASVPYLMREAALARDHGIDAIIFNFYHDGVNSELEAPLRHFSRAIDRPRFALNIVSRMPRRVLPFGPEAPTFDDYSSLNFECFHKITEYIIDEYLSCGNYFTVDSLSILTFYHVVALLSLYGRKGLSDRLRHLRRAARSRGLRLYLIGLFSAMGDSRNYLRVASDVGFDACSYYVALPDFHSSTPVQAYRDLANAWLKYWGDTIGHAVMPAHGCVGAGWDATSRGTIAYCPDVHGLHFPYYPVVTGNTASAFESYLRDVVTLTLRDSSGAYPLVFLGPWNEWSEGCYLLPDVREGAAKLEAIKRITE
jgi:Glycosyltransferase WbsX